MVTGTLTALAGVNCSLLASLEIENEIQMTFL